ncbi:unnamed protein product, partial [Vitis vinifera]
MAFHYSFPEKVARSFNDSWLLVHLPKFKSFNSFHCFHFLDNEDCNILNKYIRETTHILDNKVHILSIPC